jgi:hypothetical protein
MGGGRSPAGSGQSSILSCAVLASSIQVLLDHGGAAAVQAHVEGLQRALLTKLAMSAVWKDEAARLSDLLDAGRLGSILSFVPPADRFGRLLEDAEANGISTSIREGYLRVAFHGWHSGQDVERCAAWLMAG